MIQILRNGQDVYLLEAINEHFLTGGSRHDIESYYSLAQFAYEPKQTEPFETKLNSSLAVVQQSPVQQALHWAAILYSSVPPEWILL